MKTKRTFPVEGSDYQCPECKQRPIYYNRRVVVMHLRQCERRLRLLSRNPNFEAWKAETDRKLVSA